MNNSDVAQFVKSRPFYNIIEFYWVKCHMVFMFELGKARHAWPLRRPLLQEAIEANAWHHIHDRHLQIITLISSVYTILYAYIVYDIVFDIDKNHRYRICSFDIEGFKSISNYQYRYQSNNFDIKITTWGPTRLLWYPRAY
jgi:hypothetical protein